MTYMINIWNSSSTNGAACIWRGTDRKTFEKEKAAALKKYGAVKDIARSAVFSGRVIFSFATTGDGFRNWINLTYFKKPLAVIYHRIERGKL